MSERECPYYDDTSCLKITLADPLHPRPEQFEFIRTYRLSLLKHLLNNSRFIRPKDSPAFQVYIKFYNIMHTMTLYIIRYYCPLNRARQSGTKTPLGKIVIWDYKKKQSNSTTQRNRHGSGKRRRRGDSESEDDSDS